MKTDIKFYTIMKYPVPLHEEYYKHISEYTNIQTEIHQNQTHNIDTTVFSWKEKNSLMSDYIESINKRSRIFKHTPFIRQVYLCNSITFNALHDNSDIDICIICKWWYVRLARVFSWIAIHLSNLSRGRWKFNDNKKKICLSFYIDEDSTNLLPIRKKIGDIYLSYWIAHCVLLYTDNKLPDNHMFINNKELLSYLPKHPLHQTIWLTTNIIRWRSRFREFVEYILTSFIGKWIQYILSKIRTIILFYKKTKLSSYTQQDIVIDTSMLKFHQDKRTIIQHKWKSNSRQ